MFQIWGKIFVFCYMLKGSPFLSRFKAVRVLHENVPMHRLIWAFAAREDKCYILGAQKKRLIETVLLSTHNISFG